MAFNAARYGVIVTFGFATKGQRWQCVRPYITAPPDHPTPVQLYDDWSDPTMLNGTRTEWMKCLAADSEFLGYQIEPMAPGFMVPFRKNYPAGTYVGQVAGNSVPYNATSLIALWCDEQATSGDRVREAKVNLGPPPLSKVDGKHLDPTFVSTILQGLAVKFTNLGPFGPVSTFQYHAALETSPDPNDPIYVCDRHVSREQTFSQKRRLYPVSRG